MKLPRGKTFKPKGNPAKRPPKLKGRVANDLWAPPARSAMGPPPACDTPGAARQRVDEGAASVTDLAMNRAMFCPAGFARLSAPFGNELWIAWRAIVCLFFSRSPAAVAWFIIAIVIDTVKAKIWRWISPMSA